MSDAITVLEQGMPEVLVTFVRAVAADPEWSLSRAAILVGQPGRGAELLQDKRARRLFVALQQDLREQFKDARKQNIIKLILLSDYDPADAFNLENNEILPIHDIPPEARVAIKSYERKADGSYRIQWIDRLAVIRLLMEAFGDVDSRVNAAAGIAQVHFHGRERK